MSVQVINHIDTMNYQNLSDLDSSSNYLDQFPVYSYCDLGDEEYEYSECQSVCSLNRYDFETKEDYMGYLIEKGKDYTYDQDGYKIPKVKLCGYIRRPREQDYIDKYNPQCLGLWKNEECYVNFWNKYFEDFYNDAHPKKDDERLFKLYQEFYKVVDSIKYQRYAIDDYDDDDHDWYNEEQKEVEEFEKSCEPDTPVKYTKQKPLVVKYISKHQLNSLPEYARKCFNQKISTNKTIRAPITKRRSSRRSKVEM